MNFTGSQDRRKLKRKSSLRLSQTSAEMTIPVLDILSFLSSDLDTVSMIPFIALFTATKWGISKPAKVTKSGTHNFSMQ
jgi:hypothetical protein